MPNTANVRLPMLSQKIYKEWLAETILVQSCDNSFEGEFDIANREIDIPVYHDLSIHQTTIKEHELKPAPIEFVRTSTKRVTIDKGRYSHWGETNIGKLINKLTANTGEIRTRLVKKWALAADIELATFCAKLPKKQEIDLITLLTDAETNPNGELTPENVVKAFDILKAHVTSKNMTVSDFKLFASERLEGILRDAKIVLGSNLDANEAFRKGFVAYANGVDVRKHEIAEVTTRDPNTKLVEAEWAIWKTRDGIQYVVPYKNTVQYDISPSEVLMGGKGYQSLEYYDFFNLYPGRLYKVKIRYTKGFNPPVL